MAERSVSVNLRARVSGFVAGMREAKGETQNLSRQMTETGASADRMRRRLEAATRALPAIKIDADSTAAEVKFAQLRSQMDSLADKKIGIDVSAADAMAQIREIERELEQLARNETDINVKADIGAALAELRAVDAEVSRLNGKDASINVNADVGSALASIGMVAAALASLPAVTSIAVGVTALGGAFAAAGAGAAAFGAVAVPSLSRINDALKAQESAAKAAGSATGGAGQSAAQAAQQAMQLEQAEKRLADAQREERQAQEDLTRAREAGRRALEDMNFSLERSILSQKDAALAVREAEARLSELQSKGADPLELERAQLSLEMAQQRAREQETKTARARKDTNEANRAGVTGTKQYQDALDRLKEAQDKTAQAAQQLKIAQLQAKAAMSGGGSAAAKLKDAFADLNAEEKKLALQLKASKDAFVEWQRSLQPDVFPVISQALGIWNSTLPRLSPLVQSSAAAFSTLLTEAEKALAGPFWSQFLFNLNTQIPTAITGLGRSFGNIATGFAGILDAFLPFTPTIVGGVESATKAFSEWGQKLKDSPEFHEFILFIKENAPAVFTVLKDVGKAIVNIAEAVAPLGVAAFSGLGLLAKITAGMDPEHIRLIALAIVAIKLAQAGLGVARFFTEIPGRLGQVGEGFDKAKTAAGKFGDTMSGLKDKMGGFGGLLKGAALTGGLLLLEDRLNESAVAAGRFAEKVQAIAGDDIDAQIRALTDEIARLKDAVGPVLDLGVVTLAPTDWDGTLDKIDTLENRLGELRHQKELDAIASKTAGDATTTMGGQIGGATEKVDGLNKSLGIFGGRTDALQALQNMRTAFKDAAAAIDASNGKLQINARMTDEQRAAVIRAREAFGAAIEATRVAAEGQKKYGDHVFDSTELVLKQLPELGKLAGKHGEAKEQVLLLAQAYGISRADAEKAMKGGKDLRDVIASLKSKTIHIDADTSKADEAIGRIITTLNKRYVIGVDVRSDIQEHGNRKRAAGGIDRYATGGIDYAAASGLQVRPQPPQLVSRPTVLYGEGASGNGATEAFIPYESQFRSKAEGLLSQVASDFGGTFVPRSASTPVNSSRVSRPQQAPAGSYMPAANVSTAQTANSWGGSGGGGSAPAVVVQEQNIYQDADADRFAAQAAMRVRGRGR